MADVVRYFGEKYLASRRLPHGHRRVLGHIESCRTSVLGGHLEECDSCCHQRPVYNSCRDRHCPKCQTLTKDRWIEARKAELLPVEYFHKVFTLPHEANKLILQNKRIMLNLLFKSTSETLLQFGRDPKRGLDGQVGFTLVLHTWNQQLLDHFHLHCVISAGALNKDKVSWMPAKHPGYLFSVKALSKVFRGKYIEYLRQAYNENKLSMAGSISDLNHPKAFEAFLDTLRSKKWVVYSKAPFGGPGRVLEYLGRYTHRVAISNHRITKITDEHVTFSYRDRKDGAKKKYSTISGIEFLRRFLLHVLPRGFMRIRHYGLIASRKKTENLENCRKALNVEQPIATEPKKTVEQFMLEVVGIDILKCPSCSNGKMRNIRLIYPGLLEQPKKVIGIDSS